MSLQLPFFIISYSSTLKAEDLETNNGMARGHSERRKGDGEGHQQQDRHHRGENETEEPREGNEKRKVKVEMQEDCTVFS